MTVKAHVVFVDRFHGTPPARLMKLVVRGGHLLVEVPIIAVQANGGSADWTQVRATALKRVNHARSPLISLQSQVAAASLVRALRRPLLQSATVGQLLSLPRRKRRLVKYAEVPGSPAAAFIHKG